jgi:hypothetical protein
MKLNFLTHMRETAQQLLSKGAPLQRWPTAQPAMRDINPPPAGARTPPQSPASTPNPATHPAEFAQDMLDRMGIKIDLQANLDRAIDWARCCRRPHTLPEGANSSAAVTNHAGSRNYKLYIPASYHGQAMPLLVMLHGCTQNPDDFAAGTQMNQLAEEMAAVVYPEQTAAPIIPSAGTGSTPSTSSADKASRPSLPALRSRSSRSIRSMSGKCMWPACRRAARWR